MTICNCGISRRCVMWPSGFVTAPTWVRRRRHGPAAPTTEVPPAAPDVVHGDFDAVDALPRRIPVPSLRPSISQCLPTGVELAGARVVVMLDEGGVGDALVKQLAKAGATVLALAPGVATDDLIAQLTAWNEEAPITGVYWLACARRRREPGRLRPHPLARGAAPSCQGALRDHAHALRRRAPSSCRQPVSAAVTVTTTAAPPTRSADRSSASRSRTRRSGRTRW